jgi:hypothetical protein
MEKELNIKMETILFEGNFINSKFEGKGEFIYDKGDYFIGNYKDGERNGKGTIYITKMER